MEVEELSSLSYAMAIVHNMKDGDYKFGLDVKKI